MPNGFKESTRKGPEGGILLDYHLKEEGYKLYFIVQISRSIILLRGKDHAKFFTWRTSSLSPPCRYMPNSRLLLKVGKNEEVFLQATQPTPKV